MKVNRQSVDRQINKVNTMMYLTSLALRWFTTTVFVFLVQIFLAQSVLAHTASTSAVALDIERHQVRMTLQLPVDQLAIAEPTLVSPTGAELIAQYHRQQANQSALFHYLQTHIQLRNYTGTLLPVVSIDQLTLKPHNGTPFLHINLTLAPEKEENLAALDLLYTVVLHQVVTHKAYVTLQSDFSQGQIDKAATPLGVIRFQHEQLHIDRDVGNRWAGFKAYIKLGAQHIANGPDHLLFLFCLLLSAPLVVRNNRWETATHDRQSRPVRKPLIAVIRIVTAFTIGHTITLSSVTLTSIYPPAQPVEIAIALSIIVSALYAIWPLFKIGVAPVAAGFGLIHGLAFANEMTLFGYSGETLLLALGGFTIGIEAMQLVLVTVTVPCLIMLSRTQFYTHVRVSSALLAIVAAMGWLGERIFLA